MRGPFSGRMVVLTDCCSPENIKKGPLIRLGRNRPIHLLPQGAKAAPHHYR